jgi:heptosyltransferase II
VQSIKPSRILIVGPNWVGDMVMAQSLFITLKQLDPHCVIDVLAPAWTRPLPEHMPEVARTIEIPLQRGELGIGKRYRLGKSLARNQYTRAILLPNSLKSALIPFIAGIPQRTGYLGEQRWGLVNDVRRLDRSVLTQTVQRFVALAHERSAALPPACPEPRLFVTNTEVRKALRKFAVPEALGPVLGLCPGAEYGPAKRWPERYFAAVAAARLDQGWEVWLFGSGNDLEICKRINRQTGQRCRNFAGLTSLSEAIVLLSLTRSVVTNDSGLMHVAAALGTKLVALYGSSDPYFTPPLTRSARVLSLGLPCSPCFERECPLGHFRCLNDIEPARVIACLDQL